jgi:hypothetical protein
MTLNDHRFSFLLAEFPLVVAFALFNHRLTGARLFSPLYWAGILVPACWLIWRLQPSALPGTGLSLLTIYCCGLLAERAFLRPSPLVDLAKTSLWLRVPFLLGLGTFSLLTVCCLAGVIIDIGILFRVLPALAILGAISLRFLPAAGQEGPASAPPAPGGILWLAALVPLLLVLHKYFHFYHFGGTGHAEMVVPIIDSIAQHGNFPVRFPSAAEMARQVIPPLDGHAFSAFEIGVRFSNIAGSLFPGHYGGEVLAAFLQNLSGIHPFHAFRLTQLFTSFMTFGWAVVMLAPILKTPWASLAWAAVVAFHLNDNHYIDRDLEVMAMLGAYYLAWSLGDWLGAREGRIESKALMFLGSIFGFALYACYPGSSITILIAFAMVLLASLGLPSLFAEGRKRLPMRAYWPWSVVGAVLICLLLSQGLVASILERRHDFQSFSSTLLLKKDQPGPEGVSVTKPAGLTHMATDILKETGHNLVQYLAGEKKYLCDFGRLRRVPSLAWLLVVASMLMIAGGCWAKPGVKLRPGRIAAVGLPVIFLAFLGTNLVNKSHHSLGAVVGVLVLAFILLAVRQVRAVPPHERAFWIFLPLSMLGSLLAIMAITAASPNTLQEQYFMNPLEWGYNFLIGYAVATCWNARPECRWWGLTPLLIWVCHTADFWNSYLIYFPLKDVYKLSWALFYK